jgi:hypothetical protein
MTGSGRWWQDAGIALLSAQSALVTPSSLGEELKKVLPKGTARLWSYLLLDGGGDKDFEKTGSLRFAVDARTRDEVREWISDHKSMTRCDWSIIRWDVCTGAKILLSADFRCRFRFAPKSNKLEDEPSSSSISHIQPVAAVSSSGGGDLIVLETTAAATAPHSPLPHDTETQEAPQTPNSLPSSPPSSPSPSPSQLIPGGAMSGCTARMQIALLGTAMTSSRHPRHRMLVALQWSHNHDITGMAYDPPSPLIPASDGTPKHSMEHSSEFPSKRQRTNEGMASSQVATEVNSSVAVTSSTSSSSSSLAPVSHHISEDQSMAETRDSLLTTTLASIASSIVNAHALASSARQNAGQSSHANLATSSLSPVQHSSQAHTLSIQVPEQVNSALHHLQ